MEFTTLKLIFINISIFIIGVIIGRVTMAIEYAIVTKVQGSSTGKTNLKLPSETYIPKVPKPKAPRLSSPSGKNRLW